MESYEKFNIYCCTRLFDASTSIEIWMNNFFKSIAYGWTVEKWENQSMRLTGEK